VEHKRASTPGDVAYGELPELTRALRALGSPRHSGAHHRPNMTSRLHSLFFAPLIDARRRAAEARTPDATIRAFDAAQLAQELDRLIERIVVEWPDARPPARRALRTGLRERAEDYARALEQLHARAETALFASENQRLQSWRDWTAQLVSVFQAADRGWMSLRTVIERLP
jgi:hypothetical protein